MKTRIVWVMALLWGAVASQAQNRLVVSDVQSTGSVSYLTVSLEGKSGTFTAYQLELTLPLGVDAVVNEEGRASLYLNDAVYAGETDPFTGSKTVSHTVSGAYKDKVLRVACISTKNALIESDGVLFRAVVTVSPYANPASKVKLSGAKLIALTSADDVAVDDEEQGISVPATGRSVALNINATHQYSTCVLPFEAEKPEGVSIFSAVSSDATYVYLEEQERFAPYKPYIVYAANGYSQTLSGDVKASDFMEDVTDGYLHGALEQTSITSGYVLQNQGAGTRFYNVDGETFAIPAGKCWLTTTAAAHSLGLHREDDTMGLGRVTVGTTAEEPVYTLDGRRELQPRQGGLYIKGGRKVLMK